MSKFNYKELKPYKGYPIEKSWEVNENGRMIKDTVIYTAYTSDYLGGGDADKTLSGLKKKLKGR